MKIVDVSGVTESVLDLVGNDKANTSHRVIMHCEDDVPTTEGLFRKLPALGYVVLSFYFIFLVFVIGNFVETAYFVKCHFKDRDRRRRTIWLVAIWPVYSFTAFVGALIPRSATIVNLCSSAYFGSCLFQLVELMVNYMGGLKRMWVILGDDKQISPRTLPACCCCICLPFYTFSKTRFFRLSILVLQVSVVRPMLMFVAAALWANGTYHPGKLSPWNAYLYITCLNLLSTMPAMWGLMQLRNGVLPELQPIRIAGKLSIIQMTMISTVLINLIVGILTHNGVVLCSDALPASARGSVIYHGLILTLMVPFSIIGRLMYRRASDGTFLAADKDGEMVKVDDTEIVTLQPGGGNNNAATAKWGEEVELSEIDREKQAMA